MMLEPGDTVSAHGSTGSLPARHDWQAQDAIATSTQASEGASEPQGEGAGVYALAPLPDAPSEGWEPDGDATGELEAGADGGASLMRPRTKPKRIPKATAKKK